MDELDLKAKFLEFVRDAAPPRRKPTVTAEFSIMGGNTRADLAILAEDFIGIEIKSKRDSLYRLSKQANDYRATFDKFILILDGSHLVRYLSIELHFCDVWTLDHDQNLRLFSRGNHKAAESETLFSLLTQAERERAFRNPSFKGMSKRRIFEEFFHKRYSQTSTQFWRATRGRHVRREDVRMLSRYSEARLELEKLENEREVRIKRWLDAQHELTC